jgi:hypothetical protein
MSRALSLLLIVILAINVALPVWGKKHPTTTTAPATQEAPKEKGKEKGGDVETHKHRAAEFENGKELDAEKTKGKVGTLSDQVNALDKKLKDSGKAPEADEAPAKHKHHAATQPATQETPKSEKTKAKRSGQ